VCAECACLKALLLMCIATQARKLEGELDVKLATYAKLSSGFESSYKGKGESGLGAEQVLD
jgi:hypothetical protein